MRSHRKLRAAVLGAAILAASLTPISPAAAGPMYNRNWYSGDLIGYCGHQSGNYVRFLQANLWAANMYGPAKDNYHVVTGTFSWVDFFAVMAYQSANGLTVDGCLGFQVYLRMQQYDRYYVLTNSNWGGAELYRYRYRYNTGAPPYFENVTYHYVLCQNVWMLTWFQYWLYITDGSPQQPPICAPGP